MDPSKRDRLTLLFSVILNCVLIMFIICKLTESSSSVSTDHAAEGNELEKLQSELSQPSVPTPKGPSTSSAIKDQTAKTNELRKSPSPGVNKPHVATCEAETIWHVSKHKRLAAIESYGSEFRSNPWNVFGMATLWDLFTPAYSCPCPTERVGRLGHGGKWICGFSYIAAAKPDCVVYSYGIKTTAREITFEQEILERSACKVRMFDHTINLESGPAADLVRKYQHQASLHKIGLGASNVKDPHLHTLKKEMELHGDKFIDILKMDIEGTEFDGLDTIIRDFPDKLPIGQVQVVLHLESLHGNTFDSFTKWFDRMEHAGLRAFSSEPNYIATIWVKQNYVSTIEFSFLNRNMDPHYFHE